MNKKNRLYLDQVRTSFSNCSKSNQNKASAFTLIIGILLMIPIICLAINFYMQLITVKVVFYLSVIVLIIIVHLLCSLVIPIYFISLNVICNLNISISFFKLFLAYLFDLYTWIIHLVLGIIFIIIICVFIG